MRYINLEEEIRKSRDLIMYEPNAIYVEGRKKKRLFTYHPVLTLEKAKHCIDVWKNDYSFDIIGAWIDVRCNDNIVEKIDVEI